MFQEMVIESKLTHKFNDLGSIFSSSEEHAACLDFKVGLLKSAGSLFLGHAV